MTADSSGLGTKPVARLALTMSVPTIVAQAANASYTIIDRLFIGHIPEVGDAAMTGVGICFPILLAVTAFASLIGAGGAPRASIELGRGNFKKAERILGTSAALLVAIALTLTVILQATKEPVLRAFGASDANIGYAVDFITIYLVGTVFVQLTLGLNNFISAQGKTTIAMTSVLIGTGTSIILDPVFIFVLGWGVKGAAVANVIAQLISSVWIILFLASGRSAIRLRPSNIRFNRVIVPILTLGLAPFIMQITECLINVVFNVGLQRYGGDDYVTSMTIITSLMQVVSVLTNGFQQGIQPIIGFNFGARRMDRVRQAIRVAFIAQITSATVLVSLLAAFPSVFAAWFTSSPEVIGIVTRMMPVFVAGWGVFGIQMGAQCALVGMGQAKQSVFLAIFRKIIMLVPLALTLPHWIGVTGIFLAEPISDATSGIVAGILFYVTYRSLTRGRIAVDVEGDMMTMRSYHQTRMRVPAILAVLAMILVFAGCGGRVVSVACDAGVQYGNLSDAVAASDVVTVATIDRMKQADGDQQDLYDMTLKSGRVSRGLWKVVISRSPSILDAKERAPRTISSRNMVRRPRSLSCSPKRTMEPTSSLI